MNQPGRHLGRGTGPEARLCLALKQGSWEIGVALHWHHRLHFYSLLERYFKVSLLK